MDSVLSQVTNDEGVSLLDIQTDVRSAAEAASAAGEDVDAAITSTLEANGFDADAVKAELESQRPPPQGYGPNAAYGSSAGTIPSGTLLNVSV